MSRKMIIWLIVFLVVLSGAINFYKEFNRTNADLTKVNADYRVEDLSFLNEFVKNDTLTGRKYNGKVIEVTGNVKSIEKDEMGYSTILLGDASSLSAVRCSMDSVHQSDAASLANGTSVTIRGICTGYNADELGLGADVILNRCVIVKPKD
jgi:hypothetical protein